MGGCSGSRESEHWEGSRKEHGVSCISMRVDSGPEDIILVANGSQGDLRVPRLCGQTEEPVPGSTIIV